MFTPYEQIYATVKEHQRDLMHKAAQDRLVSLARQAYNGWTRRAVVQIGRLLVAVGMYLENRYAPAMQRPSESRQPFSAC